jgi:tRNA1(Val) A37 N6-methylase TrmN6
MSEKFKVSSRRKILLGMFAGAGIAAMALASRSNKKPNLVRTEKRPAGPVLYRRTEESERYYKTLYI